MSDTSRQPGWTVPDKDYRVRLDQFNTRWRARRELFARHCGAPWWGCGSVITPEMRAAYERYLPITEFCCELRSVARVLLPDPAWLPLPLRPLAPNPHGGPDALPCASLPDLWQMLPERYAGRVVFALDEIFALLCALADPPRFGTLAGRYPEQLADIADFLKTDPDRAWHVVDLGCGTGHGTLEIAQCAHACGVRNARIVGLTREPLEAWMASTRRLPHDAPRQAQLREFSPLLPAQFAAADLGSLPLRGKVDLLVTNGLVGGRFCHSDQALNELLGQLEQVLKPDGAVLLANRFHEGFLAGVARFADFAKARGWHVSGPNANLHLRR